MKLMRTHRIESKRLLMEDIKSDYFTWLCGLVNIPNHARKSYFTLANILHNRDFTSFVPHDENRGLDGERLRDIYVDLVGFYDCRTVSKALNCSCTMLEMLIALAQRVDAIMADISNTNRTPKWFWEIINNVGLSKYTDEVMARRNCTEEIHHIISTVVNRTYKRNGQGGLFPLSRSENDQRNVEIWYQMSDYLNENYY